MPLTSREPNPVGSARFSPERLEIRLESERADDPRGLQKRQKPIGKIIIALLLLSSAILVYCMIIKAGGGNEVRADTGRNPNRAPSLWRRSVTCLRSVLKRAHAQL